MKHLVITSLLAISTVGCAREQTRADSAQPVASMAEVQDILAAHDAAWNAHDPERLTDVYTADGTLVTPGGTRAEGRDALLEVFSSPSPTKQTQSKTKLDAVQWIADDLVVIDATQTLTGPGAEQLGVHEAKLTAVAQFVDGEWKLVVARPFVPWKGN